MTHTRKRAKHINLRPRKRSNAQNVRHAIRVIFQPKGGNCARVESRPRNLRRPTAPINLKQVLAIPDRDMVELPLHGVSRLRLLGMNNDARPVNPRLERLQVGGHNKLVKDASATLALHTDACPLVTPTWRGMLACLAGCLSVCFTCLLKSCAPHCAARCFSCDLCAPHCASRCFCPVLFKT